MTQIYVLTAVIALAIISIAVISRTKQKQKPLSKLGTLSLLLVIAGIIFSGTKLLGYDLIGLGIVLALLDILKRLKTS